MTSDFAFLQYLKKSQQREFSFLFLKSILRDCECTFHLKSLNKYLGEEKTKTKINTRAMFRISLFVGKFVGKICNDSRNLSKLYVDKFIGFLFYKSV